MKVEKNQYFKFYSDSVRVVMILHDRIHITEKNGKRHLFRMGLNEEKVR